MADTVDTATRSRMMRGIRGSDTKPEKLVRRLLHARGFRFRLHVRDLPGRPDIVLPRYRAAVFVHGCYWHGHDCALFRLPGTRTEFWRTKIDGNRRRDGQTRVVLRQAGWRIAIVWECALKGRSRMPDDVLAGRLCDWIAGTAGELELRGESPGS